MTTRTKSLGARLCIAVLIALAAPSLASAQRMAGGVVLGSGNHELLTSPLVGGRIELQGVRRDGVVTTYLGVESLRSHSSRTGVPCAGLVVPGTCAPETVRDDARFIAADAGVAGRLAGGARASLTYRFSATLAVATAATRGLESGRTLRATKLMWGPGVGLAAAWVPAPRAPVVLQLDASLDGLMRLVADQTVDGYAPFEDGVAMKQLRLGVAWRRANGRR